MSKADALRIPNYLEHIVDAIGRIFRYVDGMSLTSFLGDDKTRDAVIRNFEIFGEAARNLERYHPAFVAQHPQIPWELMVAMRNKVAHGYFQVDYETVWNSIHGDLPQLRRSLKALLDSLITP